MALPVSDGRYPAIAGQMDLELARNLVLAAHLEHLLDIRLGGKIVADEGLLLETGIVAVEAVTGRLVHDHAILAKSPWYLLITAHRATCASSGVANVPS